VIHYETIDIGTEMHRYLEKWIESNPNPVIPFDIIREWDDGTPYDERHHMSIGQITDSVIAAAHKYADDPKFRERTLMNDHLTSEATAAAFADEVESLNESFQKAIRERNQHQTDLFHVRRESIREIDRLEDELIKARKKIRKLKKQAKKA
jgi:2-succinyl-5-enolpyruvyl-6-hydroxy-3-cyclohexene-1-carboxylate synthase